MGFFDRFRKNNRNDQMNQAQNSVQPVQPEVTPDSQNTLISEFTPENSVPQDPRTVPMMGNEEEAHAVINAPEINSIEELDKLYPNEPATNSPSPQLESLESEQVQTPEQTPELTPETFVPEVQPVKAPDVNPAEVTPIAPSVEPVVEPETLEPEILDTPVTPEVPATQETPADLLSSFEPKNQDVTQDTPFNSDELKSLAQSAISQVSSTQVPQEPESITPIVQEPNTPDVLQPGEVSVDQPSPELNNLHFPGIDNTDFNGTPLDNDQNHR